MSDDHPQPDRVPGAPHPRDTPRLIGQHAAEAAFLDAFTSGRMHHGWLLTGPRGVGKATLAYRIARFLLSTPPPGDDEGLFGAPPPPTSLDVDPGHPVSQRVAARSEPGLRVITRTVNDKDRLRSEIVVDNIRRLAEFFQLSAVDGGGRVVIVDSADDMNVAAANALLKMLEEPPSRTTILLIAHQPSGLLPTIRSRCRTLRLGSLGPSDIAQALGQAGLDTGHDAQALAQLSGGSAGEALRLSNLSGLAIYTEVIGLLSGLPRLDRPRAMALADAAAQRGSEEKFALLEALMDTALTRLARQGASGTAAPEAAPDEAAIIARLAPDAYAARVWAERSAELMARLRHGRAVNLDPAALVLDMLIKLNETASHLASRTPA